MAPVTQFEDPQYAEAVYAALFALVGATSFPNGIVLKTSQRVVWPPDQVPVADQPALVQVQGPLHFEQKELFGTPKVIFTAVLALYLRVDTAVLNSGTATPTRPLDVTTVNRIVWSITQQLAASTTPGGTPMQYQKQTLGGLVYHCWVEGEILAEVMDEQMVITIPINILAGTSG